MLLIRSVPLPEVLVTHQLGYGKPRALGEIVPGTQFRLGQSCCMRPHDWL